MFPPSVVIRLCRGLWDERTAVPAAVALVGPLLIAFGHRFGWHRGVLYRYAGGVVLRRLRSVRAYAWPELTTKTHGSWVTEGDKSDSVL
ncbi:hypothetical protein [Streptomyces herbicida]|uniref:hypothetical protein n=1 Tax=Streptomyces herbicida TaxID=3065675 RepID=UPI00292EA38A|nr:hypothetical protein [Streptomyces sp. NEAU-HV9]